MLLFRNIRMAMSSIRAAKWRSFLTMLGIIIGVASVVTTVSLGEGVRQQITSQINRLGSDLITVLPGTLVDRDKDGKIIGVNVFTSAGSNLLSEEDWKTVQETPGVKIAVPFGIVSGVPRYDGRQMSTGYIIGSTTDVPEILNQKVEFGDFFSAGDQNRRVAVIGKRVAEQLFNENVPIGKTLQIRGQDFIVRGVFEEFASSPLTTATDYNAAIFVPYEVGKQLSGGQLQMYQILAKPVETAKPQPTVKAIENRLLSVHAGREDFTILRQEENLAIANNVLTLLTALIAGVAAISLVVGGIGVMNVMLVSVTERTKEIGIRKAVGATNQQIMSQFLTESMVLSIIGGIIGVLTAILANYLIRIFTNLQPVVTLPIVLVSTGVALIVGMIFGVMPAMRAARKDPIQSLRAE